MAQWFEWFEWFEWFNDFLLLLNFHYLAQTKKLLKISLKRCLNLISVKTMQLFKTQPLNTGDSIQPILNEIS